MKKLSLALAAIAASFWIIVGCNENSGSTGGGNKDTMAAAPAPETKAPEAEAPAQPMDSAAVTKAWQDYMTPGDMHKMLESMNGKWNEDVTYWMAPGAPPQKNTMTCENKMIMGGRYTQSVHKGTFDDKPYEGISTLGYNNADKQFENTYIDNMGTGMMVLKGTWDEASKTMTLKGQHSDPAAGKPTEVREVLKIVDDNTQVMEMYQTQNGQEFKSMEIKFTRKG